MIIRLIVGVVDFSRRHALAVVLTGLMFAVFSGWYASERLGVSTDTDLMFADSLPWRQKAIAMAHDFPQFQDLLVAVIEGRTPEEADATADALARAVAADTAHFLSVRRPDASPFFERQGFLLLDQEHLTVMLEQTIDAQPFLGLLAADPSARGIFRALSLLGLGVTNGENHLDLYGTSIRGFHLAMADALAGHPRPLSWQNLLGAGVSELAGPYRFVLMRPRLDHSALEPGGEATRSVRNMIAQLEFVRSGDARVRLTGQIALSDEEFATIAKGVVGGMIVSTLLIALLLYMAVRSWRLMVPVLATLNLGLMLTVLFAAAAVGRLNLVSVGFGVLFLGLADDFADQFAVRYREQRLISPEPAEAMAHTAAATGGQILTAALATAAGFLAFVPTSFSGVAELGLIAGVGMLIAFVCNLTFLPAVIALCRPRGEASDIGFDWATPLDPLIVRWRWPVMAFFAAICVVAAVLAPRLSFDSDPLHTKNPDTEAMRTLRDLVKDPVTNPYTIDIITKSVGEAKALAKRLKTLPSVASVLSIDNFVPDDQAPKLARIADANAVLAVTLTPESPPAPVTPEELRLAATAALVKIDPALAKLPADHPLADIARDLHLLEAAPDQVLLTTNAALTRFLPVQLARLRTGLSAGPMTLESVPPEILRDWVLPDGRALVRVTAKPEALAGAGLKGFVDQVGTMTPDAAGSAVTIVATSETIVSAFRSAAVYALAAITFIMVVATRRVLDVVLVLAPLLMSVLMTLLVSVLWPMPLNFANIIALPLLMGVGVSFNVYTVGNWRAGQTAPLASATTKAIVYSALTTAVAFGSLALSDHPGTASMGTLLTISLTCSLIASLVFLPALLGCVGAPRSN